MKSTSVSSASFQPQEVTNCLELMMKLTNEIEIHLSSIPDDTLQMLVELSDKQTSNLFKLQKNNNMQSIHYEIYRAYVMGILLEKARVQNE